MRFMAETFELEMFEFEGIQAQSLWIATFGKQQDASTSMVVPFKNGYNSSGFANVLPEYWQSKSRAIMVVAGFGEHVAWCLTHATH